MSGRGSLEAADLGGEEGEAITMTTIQEEMTTSTTSDSVCPTHITIHLSDKEKGSLSDEEKGGGAATVDAILHGRVGDTANKEKIRTTATEKEKDG